MAGRPRMTIRRLDTLAADAKKLADGITRKMPDQYRDLENSKSPDDPVGRQWHVAAAHADATRHALNDLAERIAARAGLNRKLTPSSLIEIDGEQHRLEQWAEIVGTPVHVLLYRLTVAKQDTEDAIYRSVTEEELANINGYYGVKNGGGHGLKIEANFDDTEPADEPTDGGDDQAVEGEDAGCEG